jgi:glycosyltransferase involved in cell wall biosynthesis
MRVSVIVPCYNSARWIEETLESVRIQSISDLELIVVDDGSTDESALIIQHKFPEAILIRTQNQGPSQARNLGTARATGEFIQYLDADDLLCPDKLTKQLAVLRETGADVAYGDWQYLSQNDLGQFVPDRIVRRQIQGDADIALFTHFWCPPAAYLFHQRIVKLVGGWRRNLPIIQDARFALDCALYGGQFVYVPGIMAKYRKHIDGSVSTHNRIAFVQDLLQIALEVELWWSSKALLDAARREALLQVYGQTARASFEDDQQTFLKAYAMLERLQPGYWPTTPRKLAILSRMFGYPRAETLAVQYRRLKRAIRP